MEIKKYKELPHSKSILIADKDMLEVFLLTGHEDLISNLYEEIYVTPEIYRYFIRNLDVNVLKRFNKIAKEIKYDADLMAIRDVMTKYQIMTNDESFAVVAASANKMDVMLDDPRKAAIFEARSIHTIRPSELVTAAALTKTNE